MSANTTLLMDTIRTYEQHLMNTISNSQKQTEHHLLETLREMDEQQRVDSRIKWTEMQSKINRISSDLQEKTTTLRDQINLSFFQMMNKKLAESKSEMERKFEEINKQIGQVFARLDVIETEMKRMDDQQRHEAHHRVQRTMEVDEKLRMIEERLDKIENKRHIQREVVTRLNQVTVTAGTSDKDTKENWEKAQSISQPRDENKNGESQRHAVTTVQELGPLVRTVCQTYTQLVKHVKTAPTTSHYNILLLGESYTQKTTFLNNINNLLKNSNTIHINNIELDATDDDRKCIAYEFQFEKCVLRFIQSPFPTTHDNAGQTLSKKNKEMTEGDRQGLVEMLSCTRKLKILHAIVCVTKSSQKTPSPQLVSCAKELFRHLDKSFVNNLTFAVTDVDVSQLKEVRLRVEEYSRELSQACGLTIPLDNTFFIYNNSSSEMSEWTRKESAQQCQLLLRHIMQLRRWKHRSNSIIRTSWW